jgi:SAM-dependent methyltransferase
MPSAQGYLEDVRHEESAQVWNAGDRYEPYVGRWSRLVAREFLAWLAPPEQLAWLDVGCGTGALTAAILEQCNPRVLRGVDASLGYLRVADSRLPRSRAGLVAGDAAALPIATATIDIAVAGLSLNFVPQPARAVAEVARVLQRGGTFAAYVWDYAGRMGLMRYFWNAATALDPAAVELDEGRRFPICEPRALADLVARAGFGDVAVRQIDVSTLFRDFDDYWSPFLGGQGPAPAYTMSLADARRDALRDRIRASLPIAADGTIPLMARAWAVRGRTSDTTA